MTAIAVETTAAIAAVVTAAEIEAEGNRLPFKNFFELPSSMSITNIKKNSFPMFTGEESVYQRLHHNFIPDATVTYLRSFNEF
jgi:hypothetical protein